MKLSSVCVLEFNTETVSKKQLHTHTRTPFNVDCKKRETWEQKKKSAIKRNQRRNAVVVAVNYSINERHVQYEKKKNKYIVYV